MKFRLSWRVISVEQEQALQCSVLYAAHWQQHRASHGQHCCFQAQCCPHSLLCVCMCACVLSALLANMHPIPTHTMMHLVRQGQTSFSPLPAYPSVPSRRIASSRPSLPGAPSCCSAATQRVRPSGRDPGAQVPHPAGHGSAHLWEFCSPDRVPDREGIGSPGGRCGGSRVPFTRPPLLWRWQRGLHKVLCSLTLERIHPRVPS